MCTSPVTIFIRGEGSCSPYSRSGSITVPCGKCLECVASRQLSWAVRMIEQAKDTPQCVFVTLTYSPLKVPLSVDITTGDCYYTVCKPHVQKWIKRLKTRLSRQGRDFKARPLQYFLTSEYGMKPRVKGFYRPHYHALFFNISLDELLPSLQEWKDMYGFVNYSVPRNRFGTMKYVGKYCCKGSEFENPYVAKGLVLPTFHLVSHGLGVGYIDRMRSWHRSNPFQGKVRERVNMYYSKRYVEFVADNLYYRDSRLFDKYGNQAFKVKLPRYYKERILGTTVYIAGARPGTLKKVVEKNILSLQVARFLDERRAELLHRECIQLVEKGTFQSYGEASLYLNSQQKELLAQRELAARERLFRFYKRSKL